MPRFDVVIIGGGVIGSAIAYFLAGPVGFKGSIAVVEKDPTYETAATPRSAGGVRQQFSTPENIQMSAFGAAFIKSVGEHLSVEGETAEVPFTEWGYLFLATDSGLDTLRGNHTTQTSLGAKVALLTPSELTARFPWLNVEDLVGGCYGLADEGWTDPYGLLQAFRRKARALGVTYLTDEAVGIERADHRVAGVTLRDGGRLGCGAVVNAAGYHAHKLAAAAGIDLPVRPRKRIVYVFDCRNGPEQAPLIVDPTGVWCRPEGAGFIGGISPAEPDDPDTIDLEIDYRWYEEVVWPTLAHRIPAFEAIKLVRAWAGHYDYNTLDQNAILGPHPELKNFYFANGFSGHGLQQSPAVGRAIAELIVHGGYRSIDLGRFGYERVLRQAPLFEINVV
ncbi:MAG: NAD(P)/FAD-dependent oxidoreductase [Dongiaceae bacterium]